MYCRIQNNCIDKQDNIFLMKWLDIKRFKKLIFKNLVFNWILQSNYIILIWPLPDGISWNCFLQGQHIAPSLMCLSYKPISSSLVCSNGILKLELEISSKNEHNRKISWCMYTYQYIIITWIENPRKAAVTFSDFHRCFVTYYCFDQVVCLLFAVC